MGCIYSFDLCEKNAVGWQYFYITRVCVCVVVGYIYIYGSGRVIGRNDIMSADRMVIVIPIGTYNTIIPYYSQKFKNRLAHAAAVGGTLKHCAIFNATRVPILLLYRRKSSNERA